MKTMSLLLAVVAFNCQAQDKEKVVKENELPNGVKESFAKRFPDARGIKWSMESANEFEAEFKVGKMEQSSNFDPSGDWLGTETEIRKSDLPQAVQDVISREFHGYKIEEAEKAETPEQGIFYEVALVKGKSDLEVQISAAGIILKREEERGNGEDKD